ncbi:unnamed protein product [Hymenolepis diminuta]|uniref:Uncharacterized protein n=1 Tax=Hymenolepis diminuta TaxID=6216 RepID=A0A564Z3P8_HYMDI|nr:unnamed protein product [Hymenolepis diminuta]
MLESLSAEINMSSAEIGVKMSPGVTNIFTVTISQNSSKILLDLRLHLLSLRCFLLQLWFKGPMMTRNYIHQSEIM